MFKYDNIVHNYWIIKGPQQFRNNLLRSGHYIIPSTAPDSMIQMSFNAAQLNAGMDIFDELLAADAKRRLCNLEIELKEGLVDEENAKFEKNGLLNNTNRLFNIVTYCENGKYAVRINILGFREIFITLFATSVRQVK